MACVDCQAPDAPAARLTYEDDGVTREAGLCRACASRYARNGRLKLLIEILRDGRALVQVEGLGLRILGREG